jgi:kynurenine formamidase
MEVSTDMMTFPGVPKPVIEVVQTHAEQAQFWGADKAGVPEATGHHRYAVGDHVGTHLDSWWHGNPNAPMTEGIPLEYCYGDGVVIDVTHRKPGERITVEDLKNDLARIGYTLKPLDIVLIKTGASRFNNTQAYMTDHPGMSADATRWLLDQGVKVMGIDAIGFDIPIPVMQKTGNFWESHRVMREREFYHLENLANLDALPKPYGFKVSVLPIKLKGTSAAPVRAVAILEEA